MGDERQIKDALLPDENQKGTAIKKYEGDAKDYYLDGHKIDEKTTITYMVESEFAKSKGNKNKLAFSILLIFTILSIGVTLGVSRYLEYHENTVKVDVGAFDSLDLQGLIQNMQLNVRRIDMLKQLLGIQGFRMQDEIDIVNADSDMEIREMLRQAISNSDKNRRRGVINRRRDALIEEIRVKYGLEIDEIEEEILSLEVTVVEQKQNVSLESETLVAAVETVIDTRSFVETYDPNLPAQISNHYQTEIGYGVVTLNNLSNDHRTLQSQYDALYNKSLIPQETIIITNYRPLEDTTYADAMEYMLQEQSNGVGYILNAENPNYMSIFIGKVYNIPTGTKASLYRGQLFIADIEIEGVVDGLGTAKVVEYVARGISPRPFDRVVLIPN